MRPMAAPATEAPSGHALRRVESRLANAFPRPYEWYCTETGRKKARYFFSSVVTTIFSQALLFGLQAADFASAVVCSVITTAVSAIPSYYLNRTWAWGKSGKSHVVKEVLPFWVLAFVGLFASMGTVALSDHEATLAGLSRVEVKVVNNAAYLLAFVIVWMVKYVIFDKLVFIDREADQEGGDA